MRKAFHPSSRRTALAGASLVAHTSDFSSSVFEEDATIRNFRIVQNEGSRQVTRDTKHYNLQMIIAVGFKVNNERAVQFRKWANGIVKDYTIKGWAMDKTRCTMRFMDIQQRN